MSDLRTAAQQALEALHEIAWCNDSRWQTDRAESVIPALRAALAQQTQTPCDIAEDGVCEVIDCCGKPPQRAQEEQPIRAHWMALPEAPKGGGNLPPPLQAEAVQEPVAWQWLNTAHFRKNLPVNAESGAWNPLYTRPPRREWRGLTEEDVAQNLRSRHDAAKLLEERRQEITQPPEALRHAQELDRRGLLEEAAELRRLHDIEKAYESACGIIEEQDKKLAELEAVNQELLEAAKMCLSIIGFGKEHDAISAAIAKAEEQK
jgi:hypothetical protein